MLVVAVLVVVVVLLLYRACTKPKGLPPGVWGFPLLGTLPFSGTSTLAYFDSLKKKFGDIFTVRLGSRVMVVITDYNLIKSSISNPILNGRPRFYTYGRGKKYSNIGIVLSSGKVWNDTRRFTLRHLRDLGLGKSKMEETIVTEVVNLLHLFRQNAGKPVEIGWHLNLAILNVIWSITSDRRYDITDKYVHKFLYIIDRNFKLRQGPVSWLDLMPWLIPILPEFLKAWWLKTGELTENYNMLMEFIEKAVEEHRATLDPDNPRDYIDHFLLEEEAQKNILDSVFSTNSHQHLVSTLIDMFTGGNETTSSTMRWMILYMALNMQVQRRVQEELDAVVPHGTLPTLHHKGNLPYLEAMILEVQRRASITPILLPHLATDDTSVAGYTIPKGTIIVFHAENCHYNKKYFEKPCEFNPDHFLDDQGKVITKREGFLPFGSGPRQCLGENLAKMELYLFTAAILQNFNISSPPGVTLSTDVDPDTVNPLINFPKPYSVVFTERDAF